MRDDCLVSILSALRKSDYGAGATLLRYGAALAASVQKAGAQLDESQPLALYKTVVVPDWIDYNGHMTESRYLEVFGNATDALLSHVGAGPSYVSQGHSYFTVESHIRHLQEANLDQALSITTQVLGADAKRLHIFHTLFRSADRTVLATGEHLLLHVDAQARRAAPAGGEVLRAVERVAAAQAHLPLPQGAGRAIALRSA